MLTAPSVIAIDPAPVGCQGLCLVGGPHRSLLATRRVLGAGDLVEMGDVLAELVWLAPSVPVLALEDWTVCAGALERAAAGKATRSSAASLRSLDRSAERWVCLAELAGLEVARVLAQTWQGPFGVRGTRAERKATARVVARQLWRVELGPDEADAALMAAWAWGATAVAARCA